jgi:hypothetical protein
VRVPTGRFERLRRALAASCGFPLDSPVLTLGHQLVLRRRLVPMPDRLAPEGAGEAKSGTYLMDSYIHFESATRATHYEYFLSIYPQPEKRAEGGNMGNMQDARTSIGNQK